MPKQTKKETPKRQAERFRAEVERLIEAGELSPTEAHAELERALAKARVPAQVGVHHPHSRRT